MKLYRNNLKNREFDKEAPQNFCLERATIAERQGASENKNSEVKPTPSKPDSSGCFGIPLLGLGTSDLRGRECTEIVAEALELGYRHIDTAHDYENHKAIQKGMKDFDREKIFLTTKLELNQVDLRDISGSVEKACDLALKELGTDYLDLYLIHWPDHNFSMSNIFKAVKKLIQKRKIKKAGVSNFTIHHLKDLLEEDGKPIANQVEFHPYLYQKELLKFCIAHRIQLIAYRPFGKGALLKDPVFKKIGKNYNKTAGQVILRWLIQKNIPTIPKASSYEHLKENIEIFDFALTAKEMKEIDQLNKNKRFCGAENPEFNY